MCLTFTNICMLVQTLHKKADYVINQSHGMQQDLLALIPGLTGRCAVFHKCKWLISA